MNASPKGYGDRGPRPNGLTEMDRRNLRALLLTMYRREGTWIKVAHLLAFRRETVKGFYDGKTDRSDVARCVRLLEQPFAKGWKERMPEMATYKPWSSTALLWYEIEAHYRQTKAEGVADFAFDAKLSNLLNRS